MSSALRSSTLSGTGRSSSTSSGRRCSPCALAAVETVQGLQARWGSTIDVLGDLVLLTFTVEVALRMVAERGHLGRFFSDPCHLFDAGPFTVTMRVAHAAMSA
jgi:hypothetical protein